MADRYFTPLVRRGLARSVAQTDSELSGDLTAASIDFAFDVGGVPIDRLVNLEPATSVSGLESSSIVRRWPAPGAQDVETNFFPLVEFADADLPWRYTPASATTRGRLRPWLALVAVDTESDVELVVGADAERLVVPTTELEQLPDPTELWAWAHVQSSVPPDQLAVMLADDPRSAFSRLVCPRVMETDRTYLAAIVAAFGAGEAGGVVTAWTPDQATPAELVVYDHWTFSTAESDGDFESLCELLRPAEGVSQLGVVDVDFGDPGLTVEPPLGVSSVAFALRDVGARAAEPDGSDRFGEAAEELLERPADGRSRNYDPLRDDPVLGLPLHGMYQAGVTSVPTQGWMRQLNLRPDHRLAAGLGAAVVRDNQEELVAAAWDQSAALREVRDEANRTRLAAEVDRSLHARVQRLEPGPRLSASAQLLTFVTAEGTPAKQLLADSATPSAVVDRAWLRNVAAPVGADATNVLVNASDVSSSIQVREVLDVFAPAEVSGIVDRAVVEPVVEGIWDVELDVSRFDDRQLGQIDPRILRFRDGDRIRVPKNAYRVISEPRRDVARADRTFSASPAATSVAASVAERSPISGWRSTLLARAPAVAEQMPQDELFSAIVGAPRFEDGLINDLIALDAELAVPGVGDFPDNSVRLLAAEAAFIAALLVGANHEMGRELRWRGYPVDRTATFFARFFDHHDGTDDIEPIDRWGPRTKLATNMPGAADVSVLIVRGALIERFPDVATFVAPSTQSGDVDLDAARPPIFEGVIEVGTAFYGFAVPPKELRGTAGQGEWYVGFEERFEATRFGLDLTGPEPLTSWLELGRNHFRGLGTHVPAQRIPGNGRPSFDGVTWGRNSAHLAAATHQPPYRRLYPATTLVGA